MGVRWRWLCTLFLGPRGIHSLPWSCFPKQWNCRCRQRKSRCHENQPAEVCVFALLTSTGGGCGETCDLGVGPGRPRSISRQSSTGALGPRGEIQRPLRGTLHLFQSGFHQLTFPFTMPKRHLQNVWCRGDGIQGRGGPVLLCPQIQTGPLGPWADVLGL